MSSPTEEDIHFEDHDILCQELMAEAVKSPDAIFIALAVFAIYSINSLIVVTADCSTTIIPFNEFPINPVANPNFHDVSLANQGRTVRLGNYEITVETLLSGTD